MISFSLTGKISAPPRRAAILVPMAAPFDDEKGPAAEPTFKLMLPIILNNGGVKIPCDATQADNIRKLDELDSNIAARRGRAQNLPISENNTIFCIPLY